MRTLIDVDEAELKALDQVAKAENVSRASLVRKAIGEFLDRRKRAGQAEAFGLWGDRSVDGLSYQEEVRSEW